MREIPIDIQEIICRFAIGPLGNEPFAFVAMRVCKTWAYFVCSTLYKHYSINQYLKFIGFCNTLALEKPILPYGSFIRSIDLTAVNKYGIDTRVHKLVKHCPNVRSVKLGHPTSVKADTIRLMSSHCRQIESLSMGGLESFPFMLDCDFSGMVKLRRISLHATPLTPAALHTLPRDLEHVHLEHMETLGTQDVRLFLLYRRNTIRSLTIHNCPLLAEAILPLVEHLHRLEQLVLFGNDVTDNSLRGVCDAPLKLDLLSLSHTHVTDDTLRALMSGRIQVRNASLSHNVYLTPTQVNAFHQHCQI